MVEEEYNQMHTLIPTINKLQDITSTLGATLDLELPTIAVVGSQSGGKSSVLESIVGRDFLPRGSGIVTRRPLVLQLIHSDDPKSPEVGEFLHKPGTRYTSWDDICAEIQAATDKVAGAGKSISPDPIRLKVTSPHVLNLTLVDLPGLARVAIGDQPKDIEAQIRRMVLDYITKPNVLILAVTPANVDIATSDALDLAREVDPQFKRTMGVLTKLDLMDKGTNAMEILSNKTHHLRLGWIGVVNRSQHDINEKKTVEAARQSERSFFEDHPLYRQIAHRNGTPFLARTLNEVLVSHIAFALPELRRRISESLHSSLKELESLGEEIDLGDEAARQKHLLTLINKYANDFFATLEGKTVHRSSSKISGGAIELTGGARISYILTEVLARMLDAASSRAKYTNEEIRAIVRNSTGIGASLFLPDSAFKLLCQRSISLFEPPSQRALELVTDELMRIARAIPSRQLRRFPDITAEIVNITCNLVSEAHGPAKTFVNDSISCEVSHINTLHPDFVRSRGTAIGDVQSQFARTQAEEANASVQNQFAAESTPVETPTESAPMHTGPVDEIPVHLSVSGPMTAAERIAVNTTPPLLDAYHKVIRTKVQDSVPKVAVHFLIDKVREQLQPRLVSALYTTNKLAEDETVVLRRKACRERVDALQRATVLLESVRGINAAKAICTKDEAREARTGKSAAARKPAATRPQGAISRMKNSLTGATSSSAAAPTTAPAASTIRPAATSSAAPVAAAAPAKKPATPAGGGFRF